MAVLQQNPTFLLREVDPNVVIAQYLSGQFTYPTSKIVINSTPAGLVEPIYGTDPQEGLYTVKDKSNNRLIMASTNQNHYNLYKSNGEKMPMGGCCEVCKRQFSTQSLGIILKISRLTIVDEHGVFHPKLEVWMEGCMDSFECVLFATRRELAKMAQYRTCTDASERYLHELFYLMHPNQKEVLTPCNDPRLLECNGGSLNYEQWSNHRHEYQDTGHVIAIPAKKEWMRQQYGASTYVMPVREPMVSKP